MDTQETIEELKTALAGLEAGEEPGRFMKGHGLQSRYFAFSWESDPLRIDFRLPCARVLSNEEEQALDAARIGAAIRMAILLLASSAEGKLLAEGEASLSVEADESGTRYTIADPDGETLDSGEDWGPLVARLEAVLGGETGAVSVIWP